MSAAPVTGAGERLGLAARVRAAPTPARLRALLYSVWAAAAILFFVGEGAIGSARRALTIVGKDSAPGIIAAQQIGSALADLDTSAAALLLGTPAHRAAATETFEKRRIELTHGLVAAAESISFGEDERAPITTIFDGLGRYLEIVAEARYMHYASAGSGDPVRVYASASELMHRQILPAADALDAANRKHLDAAYHAETRRSGVTEAGAASAGGLVVAILVWGQIFLRRRTRRVFNVPLAGATAVAIAFTGYLVARINTGRADLALATEGAFESIHLLYKARAIAYDAKGDEARWLFGGDRAASLERDYREKVERLISAPRVSRRTLEERPLSKAIGGLFADELRSVGSLAEHEAAVKMILAFGAYDRLDEQIRALERAGRHDRAVDLCIGSSSDQSVATFDRFDRALRAVIDIDHAAFDAAITRGIRALDVVTALSPVASLAVALLAFFGVRSRLREYA